MKQVLFVTTMMFALGALSGCVDYTTPQGVLGTAYTAVQKDKLPAYRRTLTQAAREVYGTQEWLELLQAKLVDKKVAVGKVELLRVEALDWGHEKRYYQAAVLDLDAVALLLRATIDCEKERVCQIEPRQPGPYFPGPYLPGTMFPDCYDSVTCRISGITL